ncbi:MAG: DUF1573 domain-containing protein [Candidatus Komeilibacteria bacterium]|nr:DUF1573 domain-containing protein [Candidatus Komeilibacteria bacterium]
MKYVVGILIVLVAVLAYLNFADPTDKATVLEFEEKSYDFGIVKQSGGTVSHEFSFMNAGAEPVMITDVMTSCGCTAATVNVRQINPGEEAVLTVVFNPNLHAEPVGRCYKTITVLTEPAMSEPIELKIWAEVDLDLGEEFFEEPGHPGKLSLASENLAPDKPYRTISAATLKEIMTDKHFFLVDVHIPEQTHIEGTDAFIPFDELAERLTELPSDKEVPIVLYCRSGSMSQAAAQTLIDQGYTNVSHVEGGREAFNQIK